MSRNTPIDSTRPLISSELTSFGSLLCEIEVDFPLNTDTVESKWVLPNGSIIEINPNGGKYSVAQEPSDDAYFYHKQWF